MRYFLYLLLLNLLLLANLEEKFIYKELDCFLVVENNILEGNDLVDEATGDIFALFWKVVALLIEEALLYFQE